MNHYLRKLFLIIASVFDVFMMTINNENNEPKLVNEVPDQTAYEDKVQSL